ncbi:MAG: transglycosylase SLT domain-containing protein, partial [Desulfovibrio sp.]|nr:transglycosylase SLT domain-containing protein [Desulfovibrio sp.]
EEMLVQKQQKVVLFEEDGVYLALDRKVQVRGFELVPLLRLDGYSMPQLVAAQSNLRGELVDQNGVPLRWQITRTLQTGYVPYPPKKNIPLSASTAPIKKQILFFLPRRVFKVQGFGIQRAVVFQPLVHGFARRFGLDPHLVNAIIHSESNFNTDLVSAANAVGLMQVLPSTAGGVHAFLTGKHVQIAPEVLFDPETNIRYGTAYLRMLMQRYFSGIRDSQSREYCTIATYNMGPTRVVRTFAPNAVEAAAIINNMNSEEVYQYLISRLPRQETRNYLAKVRSIRQQYAKRGL